jgi:DNA ligase-1
MEEYPISLFVFDALYVNGKDLTQESYPVRREHFRKIIKKGDNIKLADSLETDNPDELEKFFEKAVENGCEGIVCKSSGEDSKYQAGARNWQWIKYKRDYKSEMTDTVDLVVVGALRGRGKRAGTYGALLLAAYDRDEESFKTVTKCGTGFTDEDLARIPKMIKKHLVTLKNLRVDAILKMDVWFEPSLVIEVIGAEITLSPIHTCAMNAIRKGSGLAIRFPRFTGKYRPDKSAEDATTVKEFIKMYKNQLKKVQV